MENVRASIVDERAEGSPPASSWRLVLLGVPPALAGAVASAAAATATAPGGDAPPVPLEADAWTDQQIEGFLPGPRDVLFLWVRRLPDPGDAPLADFPALHSLRSRHPGLPAVARVPRGRPSLVEALLGSGVHEVLTDLARLPEAVARARARVAALPPARERVPPAPQLEASGQAFEGLFPNLYDWIYVLGIAEDGRMSFETVNPPLNAGGGFLNPDFAGRSPASCLPGTSAAQLVAHFQRVLAEGRPLQFEEEHAVAGKTRSFQTVLTPVRNKWGRIHRIAGISRDITALKEALAARSASEERLNHALEGTQQGLWDWDLATGRLYRSPRWFEMIGREPGSVDDTLEAGLALIHPDDRAQLEAAMNAHMEGRLPRFQSEYRVQARGGEWTWIFDAGKVVAWSPDGRPSRVAGMCTDISERRRAEEALRALVGGVVHEIRNPVYGIFINLDALEATFGEEPRYRPFVAALRESAERIASLMNDLRDYGEPRTLNPEPCLVRGLLEEAARSCEELASRKSCALRLDLEDESLVLPLNGRRMHQVFRNLFENALHHAPAGTAVTVASRRTRAEGHDWWTFAIEDEGTGFAPEALSRAFEPFFTRRRGGTGLGLSIVKRVVEEHGGSTEAANRPTGGARVTVRLPAPRRRMELMGGPLTDA